MAPVMRPCESTVMRGGCHSVSHSVQVGRPQGARWTSRPRRGAVEDSNPQPADSDYSVVVIHGNLWKLLRHNEILRFSPMDIYGQLSLSAVLAKSVCESNPTPAGHGVRGTGYGVRGTGESPGWMQPSAVVTTRSRLSEYPRHDSAGARRWHWARGTCLTTEG
jgi:hypothetical protein